MLSYCCQIIFNSPLCYIVFVILIKTWLSIFAEQDLFCEIFGYACMAYLTFCFVNKCFDSYFNGKLMRMDKNCGNYAQNCVLCNKQLYVDLFIFEYTHESSTPFECPTIDNQYPPETTVLQRKNKKQVQKQEDFKVTFKPKCRYCSECLSIYLKTQKGNHQPQCKRCYAALDQDSVPPRDRFWREKYFFWPFQITAIIFLFSSKFYGV